MLKSLDFFQEAVTNFDEALAIDPNYEEAWYGRGKALLLLSNLEGAFNSFNKATQIDTNYEEAWYERS